jgi:Flp pilus assembly protein TadG
MLQLANIITGFVKRWMAEEDAIASAEAALVFPILLTLLLGTFDMGNGILANQKAIRASQVVADLVTRNMSVDTTDIDEAITAGGLAFEPLDNSTYGIDIISVRFDDDAEPQIVWRETRNMTADPNVLDDVTSLAEAGNGVVVVVVKYLFKPVFAGFVIHDIPMEETAFARGRRSAVVNRD